MYLNERRAMKSRNAQRQRSLRAAVLVSALIAICAGCSSAKAPSTAARGASPNTANTANTANTSEPRKLGTDTAPQRTQPLTLTDPKRLAELERLGLRFDALVTDAQREPIWRAIETEVTRIARADKHAGVGIRGNAHRLFDVRWLRSKQTFFELVAVAFRPDRRPFHEHACGEVRLVYRFAYAVSNADATLYSRLPMTLNFEFRTDDENAQGCKHVIKQWLVGERAGSDDATRLRSDAGLLHASRLEPDRLSQLAINVQTVRWPSTVRPDMAGHAEYLLAAFTWNEAATRLVSKPLENTPDLEQLRKNAALRAELRAWILKHASEVDEGTADIPEKFLSRASSSVTAHGLNRVANRPFSQLFSAADFAPLTFEAHRFTKSPEAFLRRLDEMTCAGCHQSRSVAGFHALGEEPARAAAGNRLYVPLSAHVTEDLPRREEVARAILRDETPNFARHLAERNPRAPGGYGAHCGLGNEGFADWTCADGLTCARLANASNDNNVGVCMPRSPQVGDACETGAMRANRDPTRDRVLRMEQSACAATDVCNNNRVGFPGGMCTARCGSGDPNATCGAIALLTPFNNCLARKEPFATCLREHVSPAGLRACSVAKPCRDDYVCAAFGDGGACIPPYFVFQLRVDGHVLY